ncbi:glycine/D-amino acid oxidase-like deaminating enzyme [Chryseobacterium bernardetii]|uniref:Glycine/D-amino acid oxidase-like deaminating enzyme n=2 Tax=Chryseobacterium TaxID=59732 RepID=A0A543EG87_9FLAO|nr:MULTISPECIES: FAD-dependent oxidoreductase [Chryseobacterium]MDR6370632.1 glycine/D-amino acid oxidase-like deaminating enzyme [Chryseobacterium vietnamense]MDR6441638.1 glycine/D-amino acid oxidase-like deaminating enzyme [Chryseobacterium bernardetii]TQM20590.1 glycine/D-amino acid oxidase-like deaminating enzyme [Chryseobacterium aquifrigidense]
MNSVWELDTFYRKRDIIIIGAGFSGLWTAISVKEKYPEKSVLIIERNAIPLGASTRNAGFACFGSLTEVIADSEKMGWEKTLELVTMRYNGLQKIQHYFKNSEIDFELNGGYEIVNNEEPLSRIEAVNEKLKPITGLDQTYTLKQNKIQEFGLGKSEFLIENPCEGSLHSGKLLQKLLEKCHELKIEFLFGTEVQHINETNQVEVQLSTDLSVTADQLIYCTNAFTSKFLKEENIVPARGQILLTEPIEGLKLKGTFHYDKGYYYFRNVGNRILLGGGRNQDFKTEETTAFETTEFLQNHLENFLREVILPYKDFKIALRWSGIMAMGEEKSPIVKQVSKRQFCAVRLSGMGVALAPKIGEMVAEMI